MPDSKPYEFGIEDQEILKATLKTLWFTYILVPLFFPLIWIVFNIFKFHDGHFWLYTTGIFLLFLIERTYKAKKIKCVYKFKLDNGNLHLYYTNLFGKKDTTTIPTKSIQKIKRGPKSVSDHRSKLWIHTQEKVRDLILINSFIGLELYKVMDVEKL